MNLLHQLKSALNYYEASGDSAAFAQLLKNHPELISKELGEYPDVHRIIDIQIGEYFFRVCRKISQGEALIVVPIDEAFDTPGVPLWLEGKKLEAWAQQEEENPSDEPTNWEQYR